MFPRVGRASSGAAEVPQIKSWVGEFSVRLVGDRPWETLGGSRESLEVRIHACQSWQLK